MRRCSTTLQRNGVTRCRQAQLHIRHRPFDGYRGARPNARRTSVYAWRDLPLHLFDAVRASRLIAPAGSRAHAYKSGRRRPVFKRRKPESCPSSKSPLTLTLCDTFVTRPSTTRHPQTPRRRFEASCTFNDVHKPPSSLLC